MSQRQLRGIRLTAVLPGFPSQPSNFITPASREEAAWSSVGAGKEILFSELERLYWEGVKEELENIIRTLKVWQQPEFADIVVADETDDFVHGFDTFLDQVGQEARAFAIRRVQEREAEAQKQDHMSSQESHTNALRKTMMDSKAEHISSKIKSSVRQAVNDIPRLSGLEQRAWVLLQATGFLDIEKLIEHRPPLNKLGFWKRPAIPQQVALSKFDHLWIPRFQPMHCARPECKSIIRGSMFISHSHDDPSVVCEGCYRLYYYGKESYVKAYKHCILQQSITPDISRNICRCSTVPRYDNSGRPLALFPVDKNVKHLDVGGFGTIQCSLLKLGELVARAKYDGLQSTVGIKKAKPMPTFSKFSIENIAANTMQNRTQKQAGQKQEKMKLVTGTSLHDSQKSSATSSSTSVVTEAQADTDIPLFFRKFTNKYPFGNVHMALRVGPIVIENGVAHTKGGALVTLREVPIFHERFRFSNGRRRSLAIAGSPDRTVWQQMRPVTNHTKRYKAIMKQVVGAPFSGLLSQSDELDIVRDILTASRRPFDNHGLPASDKQRILDSALEPVLQKVKKLLKSRVNIYLDSITKRLLDPTVNIKWSATTNNCQNFCNSLVNTSIFEPLVRGPANIETAEHEPLYLMSFMCPDEGYMQRGVKTKFDVPSGLTEEYLLRFHFGRHDEADIIDTFQEYWYDWGAFGGPLYKYQNIFPWDCTEAYGRYPTRCGECNMSKHVWAFPFDSWSMVSHHLARDRHMYAPATLSESLTDTGPCTKLQAWMRNRLTVLCASAVLCRAATAMSRTASFRSSTEWLHSSSRSRLRVQYPSLTRVKLGGIHRAQPFSHYFEAGTYKHYFLAEWALLSRPEQVAAYELIRDGRTRLLDVPASGAGRFSTPSTERSERFLGLYGFDGFDGFDGFGGIGQTDISESMAIVFTDAGFSDDGSAPDKTDGAPACALVQEAAADSEGVAELVAEVAEEAAEVAEEVAEEAAEEAAEAAEEVAADSEEVSEEEVTAMRLDLVQVRFRIPSSKATCSTYLSAWKTDSVDGSNDTFEEGKSD
ncbi:hypothetical protein Asppvi_005891 [Aspergillus pseudoviridinutans]|uniref:Uncharacterized protein n=1 Tax=Aspergillus pseudoviridinutans TaxID=1517512 RepID=A0A9P3EUU7_9EURO|nr:uncharacterized protein Asppvi_005891 [Aspergillus pseudoviridinutans]GIJ86992.1 hypothetical protein Asppvi_005891 [Aspergillus pseudoviridinutans]